MANKQAAAEAPAEAKSTVTDRVKDLMEKTKNEDDAAIERAEMKGDMTIEAAGGQTKHALGSMGEQLGS